MQKSFLNPLRILQVAGGSLALMTALMMAPGAQAASHVQHAHHNFVSHVRFAPWHGDRHVNYSVNIRFWRNDRDHKAFDYRHDQRRWDNHVNTTYKYYQHARLDIINVSYTHFTAWYGDRHDNRHVDTRSWHNDRGHANFDCRHDQRRWDRHPDARFGHHQSEHHSDVRHF